MALKRLADRFCRFGTVKQKRVKRRPIVNTNNAAAILAFAALNPHASSRQMEKKSGSSMSISVIGFGKKMHTDVSFLSHVLFSDEANFANTGNVNRHNMHYWGNTNPRWVRTASFQHPWSVNCWSGIVGDHVIGPYFFAGRLTGQVYANFL